MRGDRFIGYWERDEGDGEWKGEVDIEVSPGIWIRYRRKRARTIGGEEQKLLEVVRKLPVTE